MLSSTKSLIPYNRNSRSRSRRLNKGHLESTEVASLSFSQLASITPKFIKKKSTISSLAHENIDAHNKSFVTKQLAC